MPVIITFINKYLQMDTRRSFLKKAGLFQEAQVY
jgi:hypothetical protein